MRVFNKFQNDINKRLQNPPEIITYQTGNLGKVRKSDLDAEDEIELTTWTNMGSWYEKNTGGIDFWFEIIPG